MHSRKMISAVTRIDHVAITVHDLDAATRFYVEKLGAVIGRGYAIDGQLSIRQIRLGSAMLNLHRQGHSHPTVAGRPTPGAVDLCFGWDAPIGEAMKLLADNGITLECGPLETTGSDGARSMSVYFRDPDGNLLEFLSSSAIVSPG